MKTKLIDFFSIQNHTSIFASMTTVILAISIMAIGFAGFAVRLFFIKDSEVRGGCAGKNPLLNKDGITCTVCGQVPAVEGCGKED